jgi:hypothetical protein
MILILCSETLPPKWFSQFQKLRNFFGENFYTSLEKLVIDLEMDKDIHPPFQPDPQNSAYLCKYIRLKDFNC